MAARVPGRHAGARARDARRPCSRRASSARCSSTRTRSPPRRGFIGGHVAFPELELGAAYDEAMQTRVFGPLGMTATTFDFAQRARGNHAMPHVAGRRRQAGARRDGASTTRSSRCAPPARRGATCTTCSSTSQMELAEGELPDGKRYISEESAAGAPRAAGARSARTRATAWASWSTPSTGIAGRAPRRRHDRLPQRHDVAAGARRRAR